MKCPKCGYNSFEYLNACKKCSSDLTSFKQTQGIRPVVQPVVPIMATTPVGIDEDLSLLDQSGAAGGSGFATDSHESFGWNLNTEKPVQATDSFSSFELDFGESKKEAAQEDNLPMSAAPPVQETGFAEFSFDEELETPEGDEPAEHGLNELTELAGTATDNSADVEDTDWPGTDLITPVNSIDFPDDVDTGKEVAGPGLIDQEPWEEMEVEQAEQTNNNTLQFDDFNWEEEPRPESEEIKPKAAKITPALEALGFSDDEFEALFGDEVEEEEENIAS